MPALIAGLSMGLISQKIARWYERENRLRGQAIALPRQQKRLEGRRGKA
ncbi:MAG: hypothetical protein AB1589_09455 [Cyanobacteriota bacterium]